MHDFARATERLAKTDAPVAHRRQAPNTVTADKNQPKQADNSIARLIGEHLNRLRGRLAHIDVTLTLALERDETLTKRCYILTSVPDAAALTADTMLTELPKLGAIDNRSLSALGQYGFDQSELGAVAGGSAANAPPCVARSKWRPSRRPASSST